MTAVELLKEKMKKHYEEFGGLNYSEYWNEEFQQALEMEKQQIKDAYDHHRCIGNFDNGEEYFNETYKNNDNA
jgi:protoheme ferro-lyase